LHGTTGVPDDLLRACISRGVTKVNVNKVYLEHYTSHLKSQAPTMSLTKLMEVGVAEVQRGLEPVIEACMSAGKASDLT